MARKNVDPEVAKRWEKLTAYIDEPEAPLRPVDEIKANEVAEGMLSRYRSAREAADAASDHAHGYDSDQPQHIFWRRVRHLILAKSRSKRNPIVGALPKPLKPPDPRLPPKMVGSPIGIPLPAFRAVPNPSSQWGVRLPSLPGVPAGMDDFYDPRLESVRAVARAKGFAIAVGKYVEDHSPAEIIRRSWERYQDPDHLIRGRQEYELQLSERRKSGVYRITPEITRGGWLYFVWPLKEGQDLPQGYATLRDAEAEVRRRAGVPPRRSLRRRCYTADLLAVWLPPNGVFSGMDRQPTRAAMRGRPSTLPGEPCEESALASAPPEPPPVLASQRSSVAPVSPASPGPCGGKSLIDAYRAISPEWYKDQGLLSRFGKGLCP